MRTDCADVTSRRFATVSLENPLITDQTFAIAAEFVDAMSAGYQMRRLIIPWSSAYRESSEDPGSGWGNGNAGPFGKLRLQEHTAIDKKARLWNFFKY